MNAKLVLTAIALSCTLTSLPASSAEKIKIGFLTTLTGPSAFLGKDMLNGAQLALDEIGGKSGGVPIELLPEDDQMDPKVAVQKTRKLLESDKVDLLSGMVFGNVTAAVAGIAIKSGIITVATVGSLPNMLGEDCNKNFFTVSWTIDSNYEALASYLNEKGITSVALMAPNYIAGKLVQAGFNRTYKGKVVAEIFTKIDQPDYSVEISEVRAKKPQAVVVFYPGGMGINFLKQYKASGLMDTVPVYSSVFLTDESTFPALADTPLGIVTTSNWNPELDNPANKKFVAEYQKKYSARPTSMAAMGYDTMMLIAAAARDTKGKVEDTDAFRAALRKADFHSVRGDFKFGHNQFPIQNYYLNQVAKDSSGKLYNKLLGVAQKDVVDAFNGKCAMK